MCRKCDKMKFNECSYALNHAATTLHHMSQGLDIEDDLRSAYLRVHEANYPYVVYLRKLAEAEMKICEASGDEKLIAQAEEVQRATDALVKAENSMRKWRHVSSISNDNPDLADTGARGVNECDRARTKVDYDELMKGIESQAE